MELHAIKFDLQLIYYQVFMQFIIHHLSFIITYLSLPNENAPLTNFPLPYPTRCSKRFGQNAALL